MSNNHTIIMFMLLLALIGYGFILLAIIKLNAIEERIKRGQKEPDTAETTEGDYSKHHTAR